MTRQSLRKRTNHNKLIQHNNLHLSIQLSLDGFSFCILNKEAAPLGQSKYDFEETCSTPEELLSKVKQIFEQDSSLHHQFEEISVIHRNNLNAIIPNEYFSEQHLKQYLDFNVKTIASDYITFDDMDIVEAKNVYIPFVNINNYLLDHFGDFNFYHHQTVLTKKLMNEKISGENTVFIYLEHHLLDILVRDGQKTLLLNSFEIDSKEDFIYYLLFVYEQLKLDTQKVSTICFGNITEDAEVFKIASQYIQQVDLASPSNHDGVSEFLPTELYLLD